MWIQKKFELQPRSRGFHLITNEVAAAVPELSGVSIGLMNLFIQHTSASLSINENADPTVRSDFERFYNRLAPEGENWYQHVDEGPDDLPAHLKNSLLGSSLTIPVTKGRLGLGIWQGVYLCEHRNRAGARQLLLTLHGE